MTTKDNCLICQIVEGKIPAYTVFEDDVVMAVLDVNGAHTGHCFVVPKNHYPIIEQVPDHELGQLFSVANNVSSAIFDELKFEGTNIYVANGIPAGQTVAHFVIHVIPRREGDGVVLTWEPKQLGDDELATIQLKLQDQIKNVGVSVAPPKTAASHAKPGPLHSIDDDEEDYFLDQFNRVP